MAVSLFGIIGLITLTIFINITRIQGRLALENAIYEDSRFMMERMSRTIRNSSINYEEYFNKAVSASQHQYGEFFGCYAAQFYNPGKGRVYPVPDITQPGASAFPGGLGALCNDSKLYTGQEGCVVYKPSIDLNTGQFPYLGAPKDGGSLPDSNAFCPQYIYHIGCTVQNSYDQKELYLLSSDGKYETIFALKKVTPTGENALAMMQKEGEDTNNDGIFDKWYNCKSGANPLCCPPNGYDCVGVTKLEDTLTNGQIYKGFIPISPLRTNVTRLNFRVSPGEDPHKAFAETNAMTQPKVIITLEAQPSKANLDKLGIPEDTIPKIVLQTTISPRIQTEVKSYLGPDTYNITASTVPTTCLLSESL
jgi:hypothetical protein